MITKDQLIDYFSEDRFLSFFHDVHGWSNVDVAKWAENLSQSRDVGAVDNRGDLSYDAFDEFLIARALVPPTAYNNLDLDLAALCGELSSAVDLYCRVFDNGIDDVYLRVVKTRIDTALARHGLEFQKLTASEVVYL